MNENLIPQVIIDLVNKYLQSQDVNEQVRLEMRLNDVREYVDSALKTKHSARRT